MDRVERRAVVTAAPGVRRAHDGAVSDERDLTVWHLVAFLGELVLWGCAAWAGWVAAEGTLRWVLAAVALTAVISVWAVVAAPRSPRRLRLAPRLGFIAALGLLIAAALLLSGRIDGALVAAVSAALVCLAQWRDARA